VHPPRTFIQILPIQPSFTTRNEDAVFSTASSCEFSMRLEKDGSEFVSVAAGQGIFVSKEGE
jgi:hypothetical protein